MATLALSLKTPLVINASACPKNYFNFCIHLKILKNSRTYCVHSPPENDREILDFEDSRNVSRMLQNHYKQYHSQPPVLVYKDLIHRKNLYAKYGEASGEDARILWPPRHKLLDLEQEEKEEGRPLLERLAQIETEKKLEEENRLKRQMMIEKNMAQMNKWIAEYKKKHEMANVAAKERAAKKEALLEEARDHFGYKIQANDPKFQEMLADKEEKEKKEAKKKKKEEKMKKVEAYLTPATDKKEEKTKSK